MSHVHDKRILRHWQRRKPPPWAHFLAGAAGGVSATILTAPLDIVKTRLQSSLHADGAPTHERSTSGSSNRAALCIRSWGRHFWDTLSMVATIPRKEGTLALFRGLGPNLAGYVPATGLKFLFYGNAKPTIAAITGQENAWTHLWAGIIAGVLTCTVTNPFWVVKTRLQLDQSSNTDGMMRSRRYRNSMDCVKQILQQEGIKGLYRGLTASYIGTVETAVQWVLYEQIKGTFRVETGISDERTGGLFRSTCEAVAAGSSKFVAAIALYPHEVLRTRLREVPQLGTTTTQIGLWQCLKSILAREGVRALYGGLAAHLLRVVPSSAVVFGIYEAMLRFIPLQIEPSVNG